jgi:HAD superfamily hydrolase (TIGR01509 family)
MVSAAIFDLDGLLVDSEPLWRQAEIEVLGSLGVPLTEEMCRETQGTRVDSAVAYWFQRFPWEGVSIQEAAEKVFARVVELVSNHAEPMPGAREAAELFASRGIPLAVCSSSWTELIDLALDCIGLSCLFPVRHSAELEELGKPHPACYITTASKLGVAPEECVALEDSFNGAIAAKAAGMMVIAVPEPALRDPFKWGFCDLVLDSLEQLDESRLGVIWS